ncbi:hypothetical protein P154DRAFT_573056 [Amniculicola lignicola CBS 123094]|uniref:HMG box domain-containing protein n=1 Tax=Amniculicola lignicola CBS 123094 TaxID=1392246 RepID=A0A6A5WNE4_9PLEO|nr:hypothetical protein P154DRAFT_573056 [Amniculicola lignicola CBS 123094]
MRELGERLERLGLSQYLEVLVAEGFDTWETVLDITESDLTYLNVKLGHRRKLQRAIAETRGTSHDRPLLLTLGNPTGVEGRSGDDSATESKGKQGESSVAADASASTKRKYRRHPKPDEHAPERPPSAYVIFSNQVREELKGQEFTFTEIAKVVGERWQVLPSEAREACDRQANTAKEKYYARLSEYKKTHQYGAYQRYLEEFKAKHAGPPKGSEGKRHKLETETSTSTQSSSYEQMMARSGSNEHVETLRRASMVQHDPLSMGHTRSGSSPPMGPVRIPSGPTYPSKPTSPAAHPLSGFNSPRMPEQYSPVSASPRSATLNRETSFESHPSSVGRHPRASSESTFPYTSASYSHSYQPTSTSPPSAYGSYHHAPIDLPSRRSYREPTRLPPLTHEDTTLSSESGGTYAVTPTTYPTTPHPNDAHKSMRVLPQPIPSLVPTTSSLDRVPLPLPASTQPYPHPDYGPSSSLAGLLQASELVRDADDETVERESTLQ